MEKTGSQSISRAIELLAALVADDGGNPVTDIAARLGLAASTARRMVATLEDEGLLWRIARGRYAAGPRLAALGALYRPERRLIEIARPRLARLAGEAGCAAHLGVLDQDMVTYLVKVGDETIFSREAGQLEAYCTGIGKALLAQLGAERLNAYLRGSFVALTGRTITDPALLREDLVRSRERGFAIDDQELADNLSCVAVPLPINGGPYAISIAGPTKLTMGTHCARWADRLRQLADEISGIAG
ncbi:MAG: IclR family transcriptional regulator [Novosphingobium sp.]